MNHSSAASGTRLAGLALVLLTLLATGAHLVWYGQTPLGREPVLDGRETLALAERLAGGALPDEPFYRAPGYAALLATGLSAGLSPEQLPALARLINLLAHIASVLLIWRIALRLLPARAPTGCAWVPAAAYGLYPVAHHFAGDPLDTTLAITAWLAALFALLRFHQATGVRAVTAWAVATGLTIGAGCLLRPHLLPVLLVLPVTAFWLRDGWPLRLAGAGLIAAGAAVWLLAFGWVNQTAGGQFRVTPWQGSFNLYAANRPGADGRFFTQTLEVGNRSSYRNPARLESEIRYRQAHPELGGEAVPIAAMNTWYRRQLFESVADDPLGWLRLMGFKAYALLNVREAYNNKTYAFHKARSPALRWSPLNWTLVLLPGVTGLWLLRRDPYVQALLLLGLAYAAGVLLTYASARFRLPLVPLLLIGASGAGALATRWTAWGGRERRTALAGGTALALLSVTSLFGISEPDTTVEDRLLLSRAASDSGNDAEAQRWAEAVLERQPTRHAAAELYLVSRFNRILQNLPERPGPASLRADLALARPAGFRSDRQQQILGIHLWLLDRPDEAEAIWHRLVDAGAENIDSVLAALAMTDRLRPGDRVRLAERLAADPAPILIVAAVAAGHADKLPPGIDPEDTRWQSQAERLAQLFRTAGAG